MTPGPLAWQRAKVPRRTDACKRGAPSTGCLRVCRSETCYVPLRIPLVLRFRVVYGCYALLPHFEG